MIIIIKVFTKCKISPRQTFLSERARAHTHICTCTLTHTHTHTHTHIRFLLLSPFCKNQSIHSQNNAVSENSGKESSVRSWTEVFSGLRHYVYTQTVPETLGAHGGHAGGPPAFVSTRHCLLGITNSKTSALVHCVMECGRLSLSGSSQQNLSTCAVFNGVWPIVTAWFITGSVTAGWKQLVQLLLPCSALPLDYG